MTRDPQYRRIAEQLRTVIRAGRWKAGDRLPSHSELAATYSVSVTTIRGAIQELMKENLVYTSTSQGTIVRDRQVLDHVVTDSLRANHPRRASADVFVEIAERAGRTVTKQFEMQIVPASPEVARWLGIEPDSWVVARSLVQSLNDEPWSWEISYFRRDLAEAVGIDTPRDIPGGTMQRLAEHGHGDTALIHLDHSRPATKEEADRLAVPAGQWVTDFVRIATDGQQITRVTRRRWIADQNRIIHELGDENGLELIRKALNSGNTAPGIPDDVSIRLAKPDDLPHILRWRQDAAAWLATKGTDQWSDTGLPTEKFTERVRASIASGETWIAEVDGVAAATIAIDEWANPGLWNPDEQGESVMVHRMITASAFRGRGLGKTLLDHADLVAQERGKRYVRLDAWTTNTQLHAYYLRLGFQPVRIVEDFVTRSAALFERPVQVREA